MSKYWSYSKKRKMTKAEIRKAHKQARRLKKYEDKISEPYALATYQVKKGYKIKK
jgi:hypothetical protein